jgi:hypothetical protein
MDAASYYQADLEAETRAAATESPFWPQAIMEDELGLLHVKIYRVNGVPPFDTEEVFYEGAAYPSPGFGIFWLRVSYDRYASVNSGPWEDIDNFEASISG